MDTQVEGQCGQKDQKEGSSLQKTEEIKKDSHGQTQAFKTFQGPFCVWHLEWRYF